MSQPTIGGMRIDGRAKDLGLRFNLTVVRAPASGANPRLSRRSKGQGHQTGGQPHSSLKSSGGAVAFFGAFALAADARRVRPDADDVAVADAPDDRGRGAGGRVLRKVPR